MRCLYCGIKLKIAGKAKAISHCPECSMRIECEGVREIKFRAASAQFEEPKLEKEV